MKLAWKISASDARKIRELINQQRDHPLVRRRIERNVRGDRHTVNIASFWRGLLVGLLTTQQRSGPGSKVESFLSQRPFPLTYRRCAQANSPKRLVRAALRKHGGLRRTDTIALQADSNLSYLRHGGWLETRAGLKRLEGRHRQPTERHVADSLALNFEGLGPKQARNVLQFLGLTRYEVPIDSRVVKWLSKFGFPVPLSAQGLSDIHYYHFVLDGVQALCRRASVYPCVLDAAIYSTFDKEWDITAFST